MTDSKTASGQLPERVNTNREDRTPIAGFVLAGAQTTGPEEYGVSESPHPHVRHKERAAATELDWTPSAVLSYASNTRTTK